MRVRTAWNRFLTGRDPQARDVLLRRYAYLNAGNGSLGAVLDAFAGSPGSFPAFARRKLREQVPSADIAPITGTARQELPAVLATATAPAAAVRKLLAAAQVAALRDESRPLLSRVLLGIQDGELLGFGRDYHRAQWVSTPAQTEGRCSVALSLDDSRRLTKLPGRGTAMLAIGADTVTLTVGEGSLTVPALPATIPPMNLDPGLSGVVVQRPALLALLAGMDGVEVSLRSGGQVLHVNDSSVPLTYRTGVPFHALLDRRLLLDALRHGNTPEVGLEAFREWEPVRVECGSVAVIATRSEEPLL